MAVDSCSTTERTLISVIDELDDCLFRIRQASDIVLETGQPLHDQPKNHYIITRLSFLTKTIDEAVARAEKLSSEALQMRRAGSV
ncbi:MAG: hypothetical protein Q8M19_24530 [Reyranella sp.]|nr:hypothetical protein [Reyranella sp.]